MPTLYLASASPRRKQLLQQMGLNPQVLLTEVDETSLEHEQAEDYAMRLALDKAEAGKKVNDNGSQGWILGSDTCVLVDAMILGKPKNAEDAKAMMVLLSGRSHQVITAVSLVQCQGSGVLSCLSRSDVLFRQMSEQEIDDYWATGEPWDKAGGYAIQGRGAIFVESVSGSFSGVMGLPIYETAGLLKKAGFCLL